MFDYDLFFKKKKRFSYFISNSFYAMFKIFLHICFKNSEKTFARVVFFFAHKLYNTMRTINLINVFEINLKIGKLWALYKRVNYTCSLFCSDNSNTFFFNVDRTLFQSDFTRNITFIPLV